MDSLARLERKRRILELLNQRNFGIEELAGFLKISSVTLRKDLQELQEARLINRVWGGVTLARIPIREHPFEDRDVSALEEKKAIAKNAVLLVKPNEVIGLGGGTASFELSKLLATISNIQIVTNCVNTAHMLIRLGIKILMPGGFSRGDSYNLVNDKIRDFFVGIFLDMCFIEVDGVDVDGGLTILQPTGVEFLSSMISAANTVVILADSTKLGVKRFASIGSINEADLIITDSTVSQDTIETFNKRGIKIEIASAESTANKSSISEYKFK